MLPILPEHGSFVEAREIGRAGRVQFGKGREANLLAL
jgi:hypothetical protein